MGATGLEAQLVDAVRVTTGWDEARALHATREYGRFVALWRERPGVPLVPSTEVDEVWHAHLRRHGADAPPHVVRDGHGQGERFAATRALYAVRWGEPDATWAAAAACQVDSPVEPDEPSPDPAPEPVVAERRP